MYRHKLLSVAFPYLLLVTFYSGGIKNLGPARIDAINSSPYHGVAAQLAPASDTGKHDYREYEESVKFLKSRAKKHIWPWVFWNRVVELDPGRGLSRAGKRAEKVYFRKIVGMDLYDKAGALGDFINLWTLALRLARELQSPGVVLDLECYNNRKCYRLRYLSERMGLKREELVTKLKSIGGLLTDIADREYPAATVWLFYSAFSSPLKSHKSPEQLDYRSVSYVIMGMLDRAKERESKLVVVSGGEIGLGYCRESLQELKIAAALRDARFAPFLAKYPNLRLGGTIAPWHDAGLRKGFMTRKKCGRSSLKKIEDFEPLFEYLLSSYDYVWIYAAGAARYNPYNKKIAAIYNPVLERALAAARARRLETKKSPAF